MDTTSVSDDRTPMNNDDDAADLPVTKSRRDPVGWVMWSIATTIAIVALVMAAYALGR